MRTLKSLYVHEDQNAQVLDAVYSTLRRFAAAPVE